MTRENAEDRINHFLENLPKEPPTECDNVEEWLYEDDEIRKAFEMAIKALQIVELFEKPLIITGGRLNGRTNAYKCGLNEAWECAKKIVSEDGLYISELVEIFGDCLIGNIFENNSAFEAIRKIREYENRQNTGKRGRR